LWIQPKTAKTRKTAIFSMQSIPFHSIPFHSIPFHYPVPEQTKLQIVHIPATRLGYGDNKPEKQIQAHVCMKKTVESGP
jgi:hypothetical protein